MAVAFRDAYEEMDEKYEGQTYLMSANTLLTWPTDIDASRLNMNTSETRQSLTLLNPDVPRLSTGWENVLGRLNKNRTPYKQLDGHWVVKDIIRKFAKGEIFTVVLYNPDTDTWDMIEKPIAENLIEKFGYVYNTQRMEEMKIGDDLYDEIIYKSTAYDDHMNYMYGKNAKVYYTTSTSTIEDAIRIRQGWAESVESVEIDSVGTNLNKNHVPLNIYGDNHHYQVCPEFGEPIKNSMVFAYRTINNDHLLSDFQTDNLRKIYSTDSDFYISEAKVSYVYDIDIYYNGDEPFPDNVFYHQLKGYYDEICAYADKMNEWATRIKESGSNYTQNIPMFRDKYMYWNDPSRPWCGKEKNKPVGYMYIEFKTKSILGLVPGSKLAGRYGKTPIIAVYKITITAEKYYNV